jgi:hypothetical protein
LREEFLTFSGTTESKLGRRTLFETCEQEERVTDLTATNIQRAGSILCGSERTTFGEGITVRSAWSPICDRCTEGRAESMYDLVKNEETEWKITRKSHFQSYSKRRLSKEW